jgi:hypothetical protein
MPYSDARGAMPPLLFTDPLPAAIPEHVANLRHPAIGCAERWQR